MAQYDVYINPNPRSREAVPYVVDIQSRLLDHFNTRLTMPLLRMESATAGLPRRLVPRLRVLEQTCVLYAHQAAVIDARLLARPVATLAAHAAEILAASDTVTSGV